jgi:hypothetical protein
MRKISVLVMASLLFASMVAPAHAYIDPGSGSVLTSAIIGFIAAVAYTGRKYFYKLKNAVFGRRHADSTENKAPSP